MSIKNVYPKISSFEGLYQAAHDINLGCRFEAETLRFMDGCESNLHEISDSLNNMIFPPDTYRSFYVYEPKLRKIVCSDYVTKLILRSAYNAINPLICKGLIDDTYACIKGKGSLAAANRVYNWFNYVERSGERWWYYKMDVEKFFYRIDHQVLMELLEKKISDKRALRLLEHYCCEASQPFGLPLGIKNPMEIDDADMLWDVGITIGGGLSHMEGNVYLDPLDQLAKRKLRIQKYVRTMDDIIMMSNDKKQLHEWYHELNEFLTDRLKLRFNERSALRPVSMGVEYVGYYIAKDTMRIRKSTSLRMKRRLKRRAKQYNAGLIDFQKVDATVQSYKAMLNSCRSCKALDRKIFSDLVFTHSQEG